MSLPDNHFRRCLTTACTVLVFAAVMSASACTVRPLYGDAGVAGTQGAAATLSAIEVKPVSTRQELEVRNHLIFLLSGGAGQPANPELLLELSVKSVISSAAIVQIASDNEPSAGKVTMTGTYKLIDVSSGEAVSVGAADIRRLV